jgi:hypothetical protein
MLLAALAAVSRDGTPMYLRDYVKPSDLLFNFADLHDDDDYYDDDDIFRDVIGPRGEKRSSNLMKEWPCQLTYQFILHSACHKLYEILAENKWKSPGAVGMDACWVGYLCSSDNFRAYGKSFIRGTMIPGHTCLSGKRKFEINDIPATLLFRVTLLFHISLTCCFSLCSLFSLRIIHASM